MSAALVVLLIIVAVLALALLTVVMRLHDCGTQNRWLRMELKDVQKERALQWDNAQKREHDLRERLRPFRAWAGES